MLERLVERRLNAVLVGKLKENIPPNGVAQKGMDAIYSVWRWNRGTG